MNSNSFYRELIQIIKHLQRYPLDPVVRVVENVFGFDAFDSSLKEHLVRAFEKHGIPVGGPLAFSVAVSKAYALPKGIEGEVWEVMGEGEEMESVGMDMVGKALEVGIEAQIPIRSLPQRTNVFSELIEEISLPPNRIISLCVAQGKIILLCINEISIRVLDRKTGQQDVISLSEQLPFFSVGTPCLLTVADIPVIYLTKARMLLILSLTEMKCVPVQLPRAPEEKRLFARYGNQLYLPSGNMLGEIPAAVCLPGSPEDPCVWFFTRGLPHLIQVNVVDVSVSLVPLPNNRTIEHVIRPSPSQFIVQDTLNQFYAVSKGVRKVRFQPLTRKMKIEMEDVSMRSRYARSSCGRSPSVFQSLSSRFHFHLCKATSDRFEVTSYPREGPRGGYGEHSFGLYDKNSDQWVQIIHESHLERDIPPVVKLEVLSFQSHEFKQILLPGERNESHIEALPSMDKVPTNPFFKGRLTPRPNRVIDVCMSDESEVITLHEDDMLRIYQVNMSKINKELIDWKVRVGIQHDEPNTQPLTLQIDDQPHHPFPSEGGEGGEGGEGVGGVGDRQMDGGIDGGEYSVRMVEASEKEKRALKMAQIEAMGMNPGDEAVYAAYYERVRAQIAQLRVVFASVDAKAQERQWKRRKTEGELDERRLVAGVTGEKAVFKRRVANDPLERVQRLPKRLVFALDVSASMYRFNGADGRLERTLQCALMLMEAFDGLSHMYDYSIVGHSGAGPRIPFVSFGKPPKTRLDRHKVLKQMHIHAEYCPAGDHTVSAAARAVLDVVQAPADDYTVIIVSDANLSAYGVSPASLSAVLKSDPKVSVFYLFIASNGQQAERMRQGIPIGRAHLCLDPSTLPSTLKRILATSQAAL